MMNGKKTYSGLATVLAGLLLVVAETKYGVAGMTDYGLMLIAGGAGIAGYGRWAVKPTVAVKKTRKPRSKKVKQDA